MSKLTLDEAIKHCLEVAEQNEKKAEYRPRMDYYDEIESRAECLECATEHRQLAEWLMEVKDLREENINLKNDNERLRDCVDGCVHNGELDYAELAEAKQLLKSAINVLNMFIPCDEDYNCSECIKQRQNCDYDDSFKWRYLDEALKLINDEK